MNQGYAIALNEWIFDTRIKSELPLLLYISSLTAAEGYAYPCNKHLADKFNTTDVTISRKLAKLEKLGYINMHYIKRGSQVVARHIRLTKMLTDGYQKCYPTVNKNVKEKSTNNNNTRSNKWLDKPADVSDQVWTDFNKQRKSKLTETALKQITKQAELAGWTLEQALTESITRGWQSFKADWVNKQGYNQQSNKNRHTGFDEKDYTRGLIEKEDGSYAF